MITRGGKILIIVCIFFIAVFLFLMSPLFSIEEMAIAGNRRFSDEEVIKMAGAAEGMNIFRFKYGSAQKKLLDNTYIKYAEIKTVLPDKMFIDIIEREICGYVPFMGTYLYIDQDGYVLENNPAADGERPIVEGLRFTEFCVGEILPAENKNSFDVVTTMSSLLLNYDYLDSVKEINISDTENIRLYVDNIDVSFGNIDEADKKMRIMIEIIKEIPEGDKGVLHIENVNETPYFTYTL